MCAMTSMANATGELSCSSRVPAGLTCAQLPPCTSESATRATRARGHSRASGVSCCVLLCVSLLDPRAAAVLPLHLELRRRACRASAAHGPVVPAIARELPADCSAYENAAGSVLASALVHWLELHARHRRAAAVVRLALLLLCPLIGASASPAGLERPPLFLAAAHGRKDVVELLLKADGVLVNQTTGNGRTPLHAATANGHEAIARLLLQAKGVDVNKAATDDGWTPLIAAANEGLSGLADSLLDAGADVGHISNAGRTAYDHAKESAGFDRAVLARLRPPPPVLPCPKDDAKEFLASLGLFAGCFDPEHDRCYCAACYEGPDLITNEGPEPYVVPRGWYRFGLKLPIRAQDPAQKFFEAWSA